jgi:diaminopimelate epimerase
VATAGGPIELKVEADGQVTVDMGAPRFAPADIPFVAEVRADRYPLEVDGRTVEASVLSLGNPHAVIRVEDVDTAPVAEDVSTRALGIGAQL